MHVKTSSFSNHHGSPHHSTVTTESQVISVVTDQVVSVVTGSYSNHALSQVSREDIFARPLNSMKISTINTWPRDIKCKWFLKKHSASLQAFIPEWMRSSGLSTVTRWLKHCSRDRSLKSRHLLLVDTSLSLCLQSKGNVSKLWGQWGGSIRPVFW